MIPAMHWPWKQLVIQHYQFKLVQLFWSYRTVYLISFEGGRLELFTFCLLSSLSPHPISKQQAQIVNNVCEMYRNVPTHVMISIKAKMSIYPNLNLRLALSHPSPSIQRKNTARTTCAQLVQDIYPINEQMCARTKTTHTFLSSKWNF